MLPVPSMSGVSDWVKWNWLKDKILNNMFFYLWIHYLHPGPSALPKYFLCLTQLNTEGWGDILAYYVWLTVGKCMMGTVEMKWTKNTLMRMNWPRHDSCFKCHCTVCQTWLIFWCLTHTSPHIITSEKSVACCWVRTDEALVAWLHVWPVSHSIPNF